GLDIADRIDKDALILLDHRFAVRVAVVVDVAGDVAVHPTVKHHIVTDREEERMSVRREVFGPPIGFFRADTLTGELHDALAGANTLERVHPATMDGGVALLDPRASLSGSKG